MAYTLSPEQVEIIRKTKQACRGQKTISELQRLSTAVDEQLDEPLNVSRQICAAPRGEDCNLLQTVYNAIKDLGTGAESVSSFGAEDVPVRWTCYQTDLTRTERQALLNLSQEQKLRHLISGVKHPVIILYFIGGGF